MKKKATPKKWWTHQLMAHHHPGSQEVMFEMHEVYYRNGKPHSYTEDGIAIYGTNMKGLRWTANRMMEALKKPILFTGELWPNIYPLCQNMMQFAVLKDDMEKCRKNSKRYKMLKIEYDRYMWENVEES